MKKSNYSASRQPEADATHFIPTTRVVVNSFTISGYIVAKGFRQFEDGSISFIVAHAECGNSGILFTPCIMFTRVNGVPVTIPKELLRKGSEVIVRGFRKPHNFLDPSGRFHKNTAYVALEVIPNNGKSSFLDE